MIFFIGFCIGNCGMVNFDEWDCRREGCINGFIGGLRGVMNGFG